ncbi:MAG TPA: hypothetical protein VMA73_33450 [Streptosporangiaceae bacterium]|nr:hypothetical protein [Streptosporangiaceae bacterium]
MTCDSAEWRLSCSRVASFDARLSRTLLVEAFTPLERAYSGARRGSQGFAGRLAAKYAAAAVLEAGADDHGTLRRFQILPMPRTECRDPVRCRRGHPPALALDPGFGLVDDGSLLWIDISISHEREHAFAASLAIVRPLAATGRQGG